MERQEVHLGIKRRALMENFESHCRQSKSEIKTQSSLEVVTYWVFQEGVASEMDLEE